VFSVSGLQFVANVIGALVWPAAIVVVVVFLRRPLADILTQVAHGLRRLRAGQSDAQFDRIAGQAKAELTATVSGGVPGPEAVPALLRFATVADDNPPAAFTQALGTVDTALRELLGSGGKLVPVGTGDPAAVARFARDQGLVPESLVRAVDAVAALRNIAAADPARATREHAVTYLALVDALLFAIAAQRERSIAAPPTMA
jgi:hypothetical protein